MTPEEFSFLADLVKKRSGLVLTPDKTYLLESRLVPVARKAEVGNISDLVVALKKPGSDKLAVAVTEAMTTNESFFFRDKTPFDMFRERMLPHLLQSRGAQRSFRLWSAAASTGQEPYSLSMIMDSDPRLSGWRIEVVGTDISEEVLERARAGVYTQFEVQRGLPIELLVKYFKQQGEMWQIDPGIRSKVAYKHLNLLESFSSLGRFDVVFCRNVLIYFDQPTKKDVLERIAKQMPDDGFLVLGAAETVVGLTDVFKPVAGARGLYCRNPELVAGATPAAAGSTTAAGAARPATPGTISKAL